MTMRNIKTVCSKSNEKSFVIQCVCVCVFLASGYGWVTVMHEIPISSAQTMTSFHTLELSSTIPLVPLERGAVSNEKVPTGS
jgi:hypothetical protein